MILGSEALLDYRNGLIELWAYRNNLPGTENDWTRIF